MIRAQRQRAPRIRASGPVTVNVQWERQCSMRRRASARELNQCWLRQSSREGAVEALDEGILHGFTRLDVMVVYDLEQILR